MKKPPYPMLNVDVLFCVEAMSAENASKLLQGIIAFHKNDEVIDAGDKMTQMFLEKHIEFQRSTYQKYNDVCEKNAENAKKKAIASDRKRSQATANDGNRSSPNININKNINKDTSKEVEGNARENKTPPPPFSGLEKDSFLKRPDKTEVQTFMSDNDIHNVDADKFMNYYDEQGWDKIKNWQARIRKWSKDDSKYGYQYRKRPDGMVEFYVNGKWHSAKPDITETEFQRGLKLITQ